MPCKFKVLLSFEMYSCVLYEEGIQFLSFPPIWRMDFSGIIIGWSVLSLLIYNAFLAMSCVPI